MGEGLDLDPLTRELDGWVGEHVAVRVVGQGDVLLSVFRGLLEARTPEKLPALFWPLGGARPAEDAERAGIYLHPDELEAACAHEGRFVLEVRQAGATLNLRRLRSCPPIGRSCPPRPG